MQNSYTGGTVLYLDSVVDLQYPGIIVLCLDFNLLQYADNMLSPALMHLGMLASASTPSWRGIFPNFFYSMCLVLVSSHVSFLLHGIEDRFLILR